MNIVRLNTVSLNQVRLNLVGLPSRKRGGGSGGGDVPEGYETFDVTDGVFEVTEGELYVKL